MGIIKLIAMDMDGTLLNENQQISAENILALKNAVAQGVHIAICSGRTATDISFFATDAGLDTCAILALNGACCLMKPHGQAYAVSTIAQKAANDISTVLREHSVTFAAFQPDRVIVVRGDRNVNKLYWGTHVARNNANAYVYGQQALAENNGVNICKFVYIDTDNAPRIALIRQALEAIPDITVTSSWSNNLEIMPQGVNKGLALENLAKRLGISAENVMAFGDFDNDMDMIRYAGLGIAMGNGSNRIKRAANHVTLTNRDHGVAAAIHQFVLDRS